MFLGHLQRVTTDSQADVSRIVQGLAIRRQKKQKYLMNDKRIKLCIRRYDQNEYTRLQFLQAFSHSVGAHTIVGKLSDNTNEIADVNEVSQVELLHDSVTDADVADVSECCEVCLIAPRDYNCSCAVRTGTILYLPH